MNPIYSSGQQFTSLYADGCLPQVDLNGVLTLSSGVLRDYFNSIDIQVENDIVIDPAVNGVNGIDIGNFQFERMYAIYVLADLAGRSKPCAVMSLNQDRPVYPYQSPVIYNTHRLVGYVKSGIEGSGFPPLTPLTTIGEGRKRSVYYNMYNDDLLMVDNAEPNPDVLGVSMAAFVPAKVNMCVKISGFVYGMVTDPQFLFIGSFNSLTSAILKGTPKVRENILSDLAFGVTPVPEGGIGFCSFSTETLYSLDHIMANIPSFYIYTTDPSVVTSIFCRGFEFSI